MPILSLLLAMPAAHAFCGVYVGGAGAELYNEASQVVIARQGNRTTLTLANDYEGPASDFAMLIPVPVVLGEDDVRVVDPAVIERLDVYSAPRLVSYTCDQLHGYYGYYYGDGYGCGLGCGGAKGGDAANASDSAGAGEEASSVVVENEFAVGQYQIVILSSEESDDLLVWLSDNGYEVPDSAADLLTEYIEAGSFFFAAKITLDEELDYAAFLAPLQFSYDAELLSLPVRLGTVNSTGVQDLIAYVINDYSGGQASISNYPELNVEAECMAKLKDEQSLGEYYVERVGEALPGETGAGWMTEYTWSPGSCDPCTEAGPLYDEDVNALGFTGSVYDAHFTRLHMRYTPEALTQDLVFYQSGISNTFQVRYIQYNESLESDFPICTEGWAEDPGTCEDETSRRKQRTQRGGGLPLAIGSLAFALTLYLRRRDKESGCSRCS